MVIFYLFFKTVVFNFEQESLQLFDIFVQIIQSCEICGSNKNYKKNFRLSERLLFKQGWSRMPEGSLLLP